MNKNMLIDFGLACDEQLSEIYKMIGNLNGDKRFLRKLKDVVLTSKSILYDIDRELNNGTVIEIDDEYIEYTIYKLNDFIDSGFHIVDADTNNQITKTLNYLKVYESLMLDLLPDIDNSFFISSTLNVELLECLSYIIVK